MVGTYMNYSYFTLCLFLAAGTAWCSGSKKDLFKAGTVYDKDGSMISIAWPNPKEIVIDQKYAIPQFKTECCAYAAIMSGIVSGSIAFMTLQGKSISGEKATYIGLISQVGAVIGLGLATRWFAHKAISLNRVEREGIEPARKFADDLYGKVYFELRNEISRITCITSEGRNFSKFAGLRFLAGIMTSD